MDFYCTIGTDNFEVEAVQDIIQKFCLIYKSLASEDGSKWYLKPKLHLMQELSLAMVTQGDPANYWTYKDEDFVGFIASMSSSRGGARNPASLPENACVRYAAL